MDTSILSSKKFKRPSLLNQLKDHFAGRTSILDCIQVELSSKCMGKCDYCPHTLDKANWISSFMEPYAYSLLWPLFLQSKRVHLQGWGEPFLHPHFFEYVAFARKAGCQVSTTTCGLIMNVDIAEKIVKSGLDIIGFSLTGTNVESNKNRHNVDFEKVCQSIELLQNVRKNKMGVHLEVHCAYLMLKSQIESIKELPKLMKKLGVHGVVISTLDYIPEPHLTCEAFDPKEDNSLVLRYLQEAKKEAEEYGIDFYYAFPQSTSNTFCREQIHRTTSINVEGKIAPCIYLNLPQVNHKNAEYQFGNPLENPLEIWNKPEYIAFREAHAKGNPPTYCETCSKRFER